MNIFIVSIHLWLCQRGLSIDNKHAHAGRLVNISRSHIKNNDGYWRRKCWASGHVLLIISVKANYKLSLPNILENFISFLSNYKIFTVRNISETFSHPVRIQVRIHPPHPHECGKRRLNGVVLRMRPEKR
jgi:hypothetical protein